MKRAQQTGHILMLGAVLLGGWFCVCRSLGWHARLAENNYQANIIRLETFLDRRAPSVVLVGSSMTGRLLPDYFAGTSLGEVANLGLDGSSPDLGLDVVLRRKVPSTSVLVEVNTLFKPTSDNDATLRQAMESFSFRLTGWLPFLRAEYRPSSIAYSTLKLWQDRRLPPPATPPTSSLAVVVEPTERNLRTEVTDPLFVRHFSRLRELKDHRVRVLLYQLPGGNQSIPSGIEELARGLQLPLIRLGQEMLQRGHTPAYTDGLHLTASSAEQASRVLAEIASRP